MTGAFRVPQFLGAWLWSIAPIGALVIAWTTFAPASEPSARTQRLVILAPQTSARAAASVVDRFPGALVVDSSGGRSAFAEWRLPIDAWRPIARSRHIDRLELYISADPPTSASADGRIAIFVDDTIVSRAIVRAGAEPRYLLHRPAIENIEFSPLYAPRSFVWRLSPDELRASGFLRVRAQLDADAVWSVHYVGLVMTYEPEPASVLRRPLLTSIAASVILAALVICVGLSLSRARAAAGGLGLCIAIALYVFAALTRDGWDFPLWVRLMELSAYGGSPERMWTGSPLWAYFLDALAVVAAAYSAFAHSASTLLESAFLKIVFCAAYLLGCTAVAALGTPAGSRRAFILLALSPLGLCLLAWGARDVIAGALAIAGLVVLVRERVFAATLLFVAATSVDEYFAPLLLAGPLMIVTRRAPWSAALPQALAALVLGVGLFAAEWSWLPGSIAHYTLDYRLSNAASTFSVQSLIASAGLGSQWVLEHSFLLGALGYASAAAAACVLWARKVTRIAGSDGATRLRSIVVPLAALVGVFALTYPAINPQERYGFVVLLYVLSTLELLPWIVPIVISCLAGLEVYAHFGLREFLNPLLFVNADVGMFGVRTDARTLFTELTIGAVGTVVVALLADKPARLAGGDTGRMCLVFLASLVALLQNGPVVDVLVVGGIIGISLSQGGALRVGWGWPGRAMGWPISALVVATALIGVLVSWPAAIAAAACIVMGWHVVSTWRAVAWLDVVLWIGSMLVLHEAAGLGVT